MLSTFNWALSQSWYHTAYKDKRHSSMKITVLETLSQRIPSSLDEFINSTDLVILLHYILSCSFPHPTRCIDPAAGLLQPSFECRLSIVTMRVWELRTVFPLSNSKLEGQHPRPSSTNPCHEIWCLRHWLMLTQSITWPVEELFVVSTTSETVEFWFDDFHSHALGDFDRFAPFVGSSAGFAWDILCCVSAAHGGP